VLRDRKTARVGAGDPAFDFTLRRLEPGKPPVHLAEACARRPVALVFASYSCPALGHEVGPLNELYREYERDVDFYLVYIREAHPEEEWVLEENRRRGIRLHVATSDSQRSAAATTCALRLQLEVPVLVDELDDEVARAYGGWPARCYLIGRGGTVVYQGGKGPTGFRVHELRAAIKRELKRDLKRADRQTARRM
jgi:hypothetical protein